VKKVDTHGFVSVYFYITRCKLETAGFFLFEKGKGAEYGKIRKTEKSISFPALNHRKHVKILKRKYFSKALPCNLAVSHVTITYSYS